MRKRSVGSNASLLCIQVGLSLLGGLQRHTAASESDQVQQCTYARDCDGRCCFFRLPSGHDDEDDPKDILDKVGLIESWAGPGKRFA